MGYIRLEGLKSPLIYPVWCRLDHDFPSLLISIPFIPLSIYA